MKRLLFSTVALAFVALSGLGANTTSSVRAFAKVMCHGRGGTSHSLALLEEVYDKAPEQSFGSRLIVLAVDGIKGNAKGQERTWQYKTNDVKGAHPATQLSGTLLCGQEDDRVWVFVVASSGVEVWIDSYLVNLSQRVKAFVPQSDQPSEMMAHDVDNPRPEATLAAQVEACSLNSVTASWNEEEIDLSLAHKGEECKAFHLRFDPKAREFKNLPKEWMKLAPKRDS
jgi:hypothetical protein